MIQTAKKKKYIQNYIQFDRLFFSYFHFFTRVYPKIQAKISIRYKL